MRISCSTDRWASRAALGLCQAFLLLVACDGATGSSGAGDTDTGGAELLGEGEGTSTETNGASEPERAHVDMLLDALGACVPDDLEFPVPWNGPAFTHDSGELVERLPPGAVVAAVNTWGTPEDAEASARALQRLESVASDLYIRKGFLGWSSVRSTRCNIDMQLSLWKDEAAMFAFVLGRVHAAAMEGAEKGGRTIEGAHWTTDASGGLPDFEEVKARYVEALRR